MKYRVEKFFDELTLNKSENKIEKKYSPLVNELSGIISLSNDFEDAIQYYTAINSQISMILTRNIKNYKSADILVQTPEMFLAGSGLM